MNKRTFPIVTGLSAKSISTGTKQGKSRKTSRKRIKGGTANKLDEVMPKVMDIFPDEVTCPHCSRTAFDKDKFCAWCGAPLH